MSTITLIDGSKLKVKANPTAVNEFDVFIVENDKWSDKIPFKLRNDEGDETRSYQPSLIQLPQCLQDERNVKILSAYIKSLQKPTS
jgi:hypothetical protein